MKTLLAIYPKPFPILLFVFFLSCQSIIGQTSDQIKSGKNYISWVTPIDNSPKIKGYLSEIDDSQIVISNLLNSEKESIYFNNIKNIKFRKEGRVGKSILRGAIIGGIAGAIIGLVGGDGGASDCTGFCGPQVGGDTPEPVLGAIMLSIPGALIGGIIGSGKITIPINGKAKNQKEKLLKYKQSY